MCSSDLGHIERFEQLTDDVALSVRRFYEQGVKRHGEGFELHVFGHSLGGHLVLRTAFLHADLPAASYAISSPFLGIKVEVPVVKEFAAKMLSRVWGSLQMATALDAGLLSHDPEVIAAYREDRLVHDKMTPRFYSEVQAAMSDTLSRVDGLKRPILFQVAPDDAVVDGSLTLGLTGNNSVGGYGDLTLERPWRILGAIEGANGVILLGWSTAFFISVVSRISSQPSP